MQLNVFAWIRAGVKLSVLLGVSDAIESIGSPQGDDGALQQRLTQLLQGESPKSVDDLKLIQSRVQELTDKLIACTVGVQVGPAWGSGVIITKDGYVLTAAHVSGQPGRDVRFMLSDGRVLNSTSPK